MGKDMQNFEDSKAAVDANEEAVSDDDARGDGGGDGETL